MFLMERKIMDCSCRLWVWLGFIHVFYIEGVICITCKKNTRLPDDVEDNTYQCDDPSLPECCERDDTFTCCESQITRNVIEQFQLWGIVAALVIVIGILMFCLLKDVDYCSSETSIKDKLNGCCGKKPKDKKLTDLNKTNDDDDEKPGCSRSREDSVSSNDGSSRTSTASNTVKAFRSRH